MALAVQTMTGAPALTGERAERQAVRRTRDRAPQLPALTGLRFLAALWVVALHVGQPLAAGGPHWLQALVAHGALGVDLFFVLSGFILARTYQDGAGNLRGSRRAFWVARIARIAPAYLCALALCAPPALWAARIAALTLVQSWVPLLGGVWNGPGWSVSDEAFFYLAFPFVLPLLGRLSTPRLLWAVGGLWALVPLADALRGALPYALAHNSHELLYYTPLSRFPEFTVGVALGLLLARHGTPRPALACCLVPGTALALATLCLVVPGSSMPVGLAAPLFALLICGLACHQGRAARTLGWHPLLVLGEASYALYLLQVPVWDALCRWTQIAPAAAEQTPALVLLYVGLLLGAALLLWRLVETPARWGIRRAFAAETSLSRPPV